MYLNFEEAVYKCSSPHCMFPYQNFKFKNFTDKTVYRYKIPPSDDSDSDHDVSWIDSLPFSPARTQKSISTTESSQSEAFSNAMDQLQTELNEILSSHCKDIDKEPPKVVEKTPPRKPQIEKPKKLSKCYDFIRQKSGGNLMENSLNNSKNPATSFKVPVPMKEAMNSLKMNSQSPKKHRSGRSSKRHAKQPISRSSSPKVPKLEKGSDVDRSQALSFLNHVEMFNRTQNEAESAKEATNDIPIRIDILPFFNEPDFNGSGDFRIKVEENRFSYYGDF